MPVPDWAGARTSGTKRADVRKAGERLESVYRIGRDADIIIKHPLNMYSGKYLRRTLA